MLCMMNRMIMHEVAGDEIVKALTHCQVPLSDAKRLAFFEERKGRNLTREQYDEMASLCINYALILKNLTQRW